MLASFSHFADCVFGNIDRIMLSKHGDRKTSKQYHHIHEIFFFEPFKMLGYYVGMSVNLKPFQHLETGTTHAGVHDDFSYLWIAICESRYSRDGEEASN